MMQTRKRAVFAVLSFSIALPLALTACTSDRGANDNGTAMTTDESMMDSTADNNANTNTNTGTGASAPGVAGDETIGDSGSLDAPQEDTGFVESPMGDEAGQPGTVTTTTPTPTPSGSPSPRMGKTGMHGSTGMGSGG